MPSTGRRAQRSAPTEAQKVARVLTGRKGFELYLQCFQLLLQKWCWWCVKEAGYPAELEVGSCSALLCPALFCSVLLHSTPLYSTLISTLSP